MICLMYNLIQLIDIEAYLPSATKLRQGYIFTGVCQSFCSWGRGVSASVHDGIHPQQVHPPAGTPPWQVPGQVHLLAGTPPGQVHPSGKHTPGQVHLLAGTPWQDHPPSDGHCSGRCASYWSAFLFVICKHYLNKINLHILFTEIYM